MIQLSLPNAGHTGITGRSDVEGAKLADGVAVTNHQFAGLTGVLFVLRNGPSELN
jgi:hypothetical protein